MILTMSCCGPVWGVEDVEEEKKQGDWRCRLSITVSRSAVGRSGESSRTAQTETRRASRGRGRRNRGSLPLLPVNPSLFSIIPPLKSHPLPHNQPDSPSVVSQPVPIPANPHLPASYPLTQRSPLLESPALSYYTMNAVLAGARGEQEQYPVQCFESSNQLSDYCEETREDSLFLNSLWLGAGAR